MRHLEWVVEKQHPSGVRDIQLFEGFDYLKVHAARAEGVVVVNLRAVEHEGRPSVGQEQTSGHLCLVLVGAVTEAHEAAQAGRGS